MQGSRPPPPPRCSSLYYFPEARCETRFGILRTTPWQGGGKGVSLPQQQRRAYETPSSPSSAGQPLAESCRIAEILNEDVREL